MAFAEDLAPFFDIAEFGVVAGYVPAGSSDDPVLINGIFDRAYAEPIDGIVEGTRPVFMCASASVPGAAHGDELEIDGTIYVVRGVQPDGTGVVLLVLEVQA